MRVVAEAVEELAHALVDHRVMADRVLEARLLLAVRQLAVQEQVAYLEVGTLLRELLDGIAAIEQLALVAVEIGNRAHRTARGDEAGVECEVPRVLVQRRDVDHRRAERAVCTGSWQLSPDFSKVRVTRSSFMTGSRWETCASWNAESNILSHNARAGVYPQDGVPRGTVVPPPLRAGV
jgi:hypothetical protein